MRVVLKWAPFQPLKPTSSPFETLSCRALTVTTSVLPSVMAISGVVTMAQAAPSLTPQQSNRPMGSATIGAAIACSWVISRLRCALGLRAPLAWLLTETCAIARLRSSLSMPWAPR